MAQMQALSTDGGFLQPLKHQAAERSYWQQKTLPDY